ncbi:MAG TPA: GAF domain-containing protein [Terriglobales bacterium]|nr:GAF domain-containing protein [Terriglobales bacterium]
MDRYSILDAVPQLGSYPPPASVAKPAHWQPPRHELRFPGEDGGQCLAAWARRDLEATLQLLADRAQYITGASGAAIALRDGEHIICRASSGPSAPEVGSFLEVSSGLSGESVRTRTVLRCDDADQDPRVNREGCRQLGIASFLVLPLIREDDVVGIFEIFGSTPHAFQERDIAALERMGEMVNTALDQVGHPEPKPVPAAAEEKTADILKDSQPPITKPAAVLPQPPVAPRAEDEDEIVLSVDDDPVPTPDQPAVKAPAAATALVDLLPESVVSDPVPSTDPPPAQRRLQRDHVIRTCAACGFPVSEGRTLCLDCEAAPENRFASSSPGADYGGAPAFLSGLSDEPSQGSGLKYWIRTHKYLLGIIAVAGSTAAILIFR